MFGLVWSAMAKLQDDSRGVISILVLIFVAALIYGGYVLFIKKDPDSMGAQESSINEPEMQSESAEDTSHTRVISLQPVNDYSARGKITINEDKFGQFNMQLSAALPSEFETTYYEAQLKGKKNVNLGRLIRDNGTYKLDYSSNESIGAFDSIVITVDGEAATVEGKTLPHDVMIGELN